MKSISDIYSLPCEGIIWSIKYDSETNQLLLETRSSFERSIKLYQVTLEPIDLFETGVDNLDWFEKPIFFQNGLIGTSQYTSDKTPELKNIKIHELDGNIIWQNENAFWNSDALNILDETGVPVALDFLSFKEETSDQLKQPIIYTHESEHFKSFSEFIGRGELLGNVEYFELSPESFVISYNIGSEQNSQCFLEIYEQKEGLIHSQKISSNENGMAFDTFFVIDNLLIYTVEKSTLDIIKL